MLSRSWGGSWARRCRTVLVVSGAFGFACGGSTSDIGRGGTNDRDAGMNAGTGGRASVGTGGTAGRSTGGTAAGGAATGGGTSIDASVTGGAASDSGSNGGTPGTGGGSTDATIDRITTYTSCDQATGSLPRASGLYLIAGTNYVNTEVLAIDLGTRQVVARTPFANGDAVPIASGGRGFILEREKGALNVLTSSGTVARRIPLAVPDGGATPISPQDVVLVPGASKAYVPLRDANQILIVDVDAGAVVGRIDVSAFMATGDTDGKVDVGKGFFDPALRRAYFTLSRVDRTSLGTPPYLLTCPAQSSLLIGVDEGTNTFVDLDPSSSGMGLALDFVDPVEVVFDPGRRRAVLASTGCFEGPDGGRERVRYGVEAANIDSLSSAILATRDASQTYDHVMVLADGTVIAGQINGLEWRRVSRGAFGCWYTGVGFWPVVEQADVVLGLEAFGLDAGEQWYLKRIAVFSKLDDPTLSIPFTVPAISVWGTAYVR